MLWRCGLVPRNVTHATTHAGLRVIFAVDCAPNFPTFSGNILLFLPGVHHIEVLTQRITGNTLFASVRDAVGITTLHSNVDPSTYAHLFRATPRPRKLQIILATNIAETGVTIPNVGLVLDSGKENQLHSHSTSPTASTSQLQCVCISQASAVQRRGRSGRTNPGVCVHVYTRQTYDRFVRHTVPEILRIPVQEAVVHTMLCAPPQHVFAILHQMLDPPSSQALRHALFVLQRSGVITVSSPAPPTPPQSTCNSVGGLDSHSNADGPATAASVAVYDITLTVQARQLLPYPFPL
uniref:ATP-dependent RNA helicase DHX29 n=1 Tax=Lygus hesperus TaxID=30085 RepID=A0A146LBT7_LYGHE